MRKASKVLIISLVVFSLAFNSILAVVLYTDYLHLGQMLKLVLLVKGKALKPVTIGSMLDGAAGGMVQALQDPYSEYLTTENFGRLQEQMEGIFGGVGLILDASKAEELKVQGVLSGSPAERAGVQKGDLIVAINGKAVADITAMEAADLMKGPVGSEVSLSVLRGKGARREFKLKRELINIKSVEGKILRIPEPVAYIKINAFSDHTAAELNEYWNGLPEVKGVVLDLRDDPGGSLEAAVEAGNYFLPRGPVVHLVYRDGKRETYEVRGGKLKVPLMVLVNKGTASAAEILAAAVQDTASGLIIGSRTYGKGVVQTIYDLGGNTGLKLTTAKYLSPLGKDINQVGIRPDVAVEKHGDTDNVLAEALKLLAERVNSFSFR